MSPDRTRRRFVEAFGDSSATTWRGNAPSLVVNRYQEDTRTRCGGFPPWREFAKEVPGNTRAGGGNLQEQGETKDLASGDTMGKATYQARPPVEFPGPGQERAHNQTEGWR